MKKPIRPIRLEGDIAYVTLTRGYTAVIDVDDVPLVGQWSWTAKVERHTVYAVRNERTFGGKQRTVRLHRILMGEPKGFAIDHRDGDGLNNRRRGDKGNLRLATNAENSRNQRLAEHSSSGLKGVSWRKDTGKWVAYIRLNGKRHHLGFYTMSELAHAAYREASARLHGEFGRVA